MKKIIVTGATSMIGTALIETAVREGTQVYALVRPDTQRLQRLNGSPLVHTVYASLEDLKDIRGLPEDCDVFYHFAWSGTGKAQRDCARIHELNIGYTLDAAELAARCGCRRFVGAGSQAEYGPVYDIIDENTKFAPVISYGIAKYAAGTLSRRYCAQMGLEHSWGRIFSVYGPHDNPGTMIDHALNCFMKGETAQFSAALHYWNYLYESDAGEMFFLLGKDSTPPGEWLIADNHCAPLREYIDILMEEFGAGAKAVFAEKTAEPIPGLNVRADKTSGLYTPKVSFREGIRKTIRARRGKQE